jgi:hypothetical protein
MKITKRELEKALNFSTNAEISQLFLNQNSWKNRQDGDPCFINGCYNAVDYEMVICETHLGIYIKYYSQENDKKCEWAAWTLFILDAHGYDYTVSKHRC